MFNYGTKFAGLGYGTFPAFSAKNASGPTATDGFPYTADSVNDWIGFTQALLNRAGFTPSGNAEVNGASQLITALMRGGAQMPGIIVATAIPQEKMPQNRLFLLAGNIIDITGDYAAMAANVYVGDSLNPSAEAFYKCDSGGARNVNGSYMKLPDCRGLFIRSAGSQMRTVSWTDYNGTPHSANTTYDGGGIGKWQGDRMRNIAGSIYAIADTGWGALFSSDASTWFYPGSGGSWITRSILHFESSLFVPVGADNAPASISLNYAITF